MPPFLLKSIYSTVVKNVPTLVVHADSNSETENRHFLAQREVPGGPGGTANHQLCCRPCSPELSSSLCHDYTHQGPHRDTDCSASEVQAVVGATLGDTETETETAWPNAASSGHSEEDEKREELVKDIMGKDKSLVDILDQSKMKTTMDLMEGIYPQGEQILEGAQQRKKSGPKQTSPKTTQESVVTIIQYIIYALTLTSSWSQKNHGLKVKCPNFWLHSFETFIIMFLSSRLFSPLQRTLVEKRKLLIRQHEDAKELKENLDRRERLVYDILASHLSVESLADYQHFVKMKSALIIEQRKLEDRIKLGEEQLKCLKDSLPLEQRLRY
uniref:ASD2 domain-containing protein n=1 Tax=Astyanax mexicanus TaxID=7994 RepID=A0A8B9HI52_ASTMX